MFHHSTTGYMRKRESLLENDRYEMLWDFEIQTDLLIPARRPDRVIVKKKKRQNLP